METAPHFGNDYDEMLQQGLRYSGEEKNYFIRGRVEKLGASLPAAFSPRKILDFGCGIGNTTLLLSKTYPGAAVTGVDTSLESLDHARLHFMSEKTVYLDYSSFTSSAEFDLCYVNGVFHHIPPADRQSVLQKIYASLRPGGFFSFYENNPWSPAARFVMSRIPFDRDAVMLSPSETKQMLKDAGFKIFTAPYFLFYFPRLLSFLRGLEPFLQGIPLGAQYGLIAQRPQ